MKHPPPALVALLLCVCATPRAAGSAVELLAQKGKFWAGRWDNAPTTHVSLGSVHSVREDASRDTHGKTPPPPSLRQSASSPKHFPLPHRLHDSSLTTTPSRLSRKPHRMHANLTQLASSCQIIPEKVPGAVIRRRPLQEKKTDSCTRVPQASSPRQIQGRENQHGTSRKHSVENKRTRVRRHQQQEHARFRRCTAGPDKARAIPSPTVGKKSTVSGSVPLSTFSLSQGGQEVEVVALPVGLISGGHCAGGSALGWKGEGGLRLLSCGVNVLRAVGRDFRRGGCRRDGTTFCQGRLNLSGER
ncbi:hypothetical protein MPH_02720 [Macrophomina phaseolina MS6]|uniref:Uncharacterized protein n=1 Tax=Macrophomina phaseolina (strain MS6) TaxID=1126212 RepID=K2STG2_MACPH|nr:hypothetical protein MPH_02720 [Macrophomina phaseolina MS6]